MCPQWQKFSHVSTLVAMARASTLNRGEYLGDCCVHRHRLCRRGLLLRGSEPAEHLLHVDRLQSEAKAKQSKARKAHSRSVPLTTGDEKRALWTLALSQLVF